MTKAQEAISDLVAQTAGSESNLYPFVRDVFVDAFGYPKDHVRVNEKEKKGIPDVSLIPADASLKSAVFWVVCEVKKERGAFRSKAYRQDRWAKQLKRYVGADTVYALLIDPITIAVFRPDGTEVKVVELDKHSADEILSGSLTSLLYKNSVCEASLSAFKEGTTTSRYLDVTDEASREKFYEALRVSARELIDYSAAKLDQLDLQYQAYLAELRDVDAKVKDYVTPEVLRAKNAIRQKYKPAIDMFEGTLKEFEARIGRSVPSKADEAHTFLQNAYATEGSSLVLARILFVRFLEDHGMTKKKISNGGIKAFRQYYDQVKDNYQYLLTDAYRDAEHIYARLFEPTIFDWSHKGNGQLSRLLLRIFYRLNAFDFEKITGDILGNLYERFLDLDKRKKLGEYYTPMPVARYVLDRIGFYENPGPLIDPSCGSGTFLIAATTGMIDRLTAKGVQPEVAVQEVLKLIHGLDINMFAAFIAQLQLLWHLLPILVKANISVMPDLKIYGGVNSLE
ncbi:MAG: N-6 DNA methylase, partial [Nitrososphaerales archaeon]